METLKITPPSIRATIVQAGGNDGATITFAVSKQELEKWIDQRGGIHVYQGGILTFATDGERMKEIGAALGWTDIHGGPEEGGAYWRGTPPGSNRVVPCPDWLKDPQFKDSPCG